MVHVKEKEKNSLQLGVLASYVHTYFISSTDVCSIISQSTFTGISLWPLRYSMQKGGKKGGVEGIRKTHSDRVRRHWRHDNNLNRAHTVKMLHGDGDRLDSGQGH